MKRILPDMTKAKAHWIRRTSEIPDFIDVPMSDGRRVRFSPEIDQPAPVFRDKLEKFDKICIGYPIKKE